MKKGKHRHQNLLRDKLQLAPANQLKMERDEERIVVPPSRGPAQLKKRRGVWVSYSGEPLTASTVRKTVERIRRERDVHNLEPL